jgi:peptidoglycan/LPS O-acetylase OafA/YrhL
MSETGASIVKKSYVYFPNLDGIRAIAALMVVVAHIELHKAQYGLQRFDIDLRNFGKVGVTIFFALSGFLISYLLMVERNNFKKVALKAFYVRRILRIWPLYYLLIIVGFFIFPAEGSSKALWLCIFFLPNLAFPLELLPSIFDPVWSIGTEEQFYIFHPHIFRAKKVQNILYILIAITVVLIIANLTVRHLPFQNSFIKTLGIFLYYARFHNMMIGAIIAVLYFNTKNPAFNFKFQGLFNLIFKKYMQVVILVVFIAFIAIYVRREVPQGDIVLSFLAALVIVNLCETSNSIISLNNGQLKYIGKISYGIYLLHKFPLFMMLYLVKTYMPAAGMPLQNIVIYAGTIIAIIALASLSYYGYERYFLRLKSKFQKISQNKTEAAA